MMTATNSDKVNEIVARHIQYETECWFLHGHVHEWKRAQMTLAAAWERFDSAKSAVKSARKSLAHWYNLTEPAQEASCHVWYHWTHRDRWIASYTSTLAEAQATLRIRRTELAAAQAEFDEKQRIVDMRAGR